MIDNIKIKKSGNTLSILLIILAISYNIIYADSGNQNTGKNSAVDRKISALIDSSSLYLNSSRDSALDLTRQALKLANQNNLDKGKSDAFYNLGYLHYRWGEQSTAQKYLQKSLKISRRIQDSAGIGRAFNRLGNSVWFQNQQPEAKNYYKKALEIQQKLNSHREIGRSLNNLANVARQWGNYQKSISLYLQAREHYQKADFTEGLAWLNFSLTLLYKKLEDYDSALKSINTALGIYKKLVKENKDSSGIMICYGQLGDIYNLMDQPEKGLEYHSKALELRKRSGVKAAIADGFTGVGQTYYYLEKYDKARQYFQRSQQYKKEAKIKKGRDTNLKFLSYIAIQGNNYNQALSLLQKALSIARDANQHNSESDILKQMSAVYKKQARHKKAWKIYQEYVELKRDLLGKEVSKKVASIQLQNRLDQQSRINERLTRQNKVKELKLARFRSRLYLLIVVIVFVISGIIFTIHIYRKKLQIKTLQRLIPICPNCKKVRNDGGYYEHVEQYVSEHSDARFSHGICPECMEELYPEYTNSKNKNNS